MSYDGLLLGGRGGGHLQDSAGLPHAGEGGPLHNGHGGNAQGEISDGVVFLGRDLLGNV